MDTSSPSVSFLIKRAWEKSHGVSAELYLNCFLLSLVFLLPFLLLKLLNHFSTGEKLRLPPSPPRLPFIGNLHQLGTLPHRSLRRLSEKYGPLMLLHLGHSPTIVVSSEKVVREIIKKHDITFSNRPKTTAADIFLYGCTNVGFSPYGEYWRQVRKICVLELLSNRRVQSFHSVREEEVALMVNKIRQECLKGNNPVNVSQILQSVTGDIVCRCVLGWKPDEENGKNQFAEIAQNLTKQFVEFSVGDFFPSLRWIDVCTGLISRLKESAKGLDDLFEQTMEDCNKNLRGYDDKAHKRNFVTILLQLQNDNKLDVELSNRKVKAVLMDMFAAGIDTSYTLMEWTLSELIKNPRIMKKAQEEVRRIVGTKSKVEENDIVQMKYLSCVIKETLRLHPPAPLLVPRETASSLTLCGYDIPAKTRVFINAWAIQRDAELWYRAEEFIPERFENNPIDYQGQNFEFIPFGAGRKGCPGISFGMVTSEYIIANFLYWFEWKLSGNCKEEELDMTEINGLTVSKKYPLYLVPVYYSS